MEIRMEEQRRKEEDEEIQRLEDAAIASAHEPRIAKRNGELVLEGPIGLKDLAKISQEKVHGDFDPLVETLKELKTKHLKYYDCFFPPNTSSLLKNSMKTSRPEWKELHWIRVSDLYKELKIKLFDNISPSDVQQGILGNCYFLSSISALAETPSRIKSLFGGESCNQTYNEEGIYCVYV